METKGSHRLREQNLKKRDDLSKKLGKEKWSGAEKNQTDDTKICQ